MSLRSVKYKEIGYWVKDLTIVVEGKPLTIIVADEALEEILIKDIEDLDSKQAADLDDTIYYYVPLAALYLDNEIIASRYLDEAFDLYRGEEPLTEVEKAKEVLRVAGYNVDNLQNAEEIQDTYECTKEEAEFLLQEVLSNECTTNNFSEVLSTIADIYNINRKND